MNVKDEQKGILIAILAFFIYSLAVLLIKISHEASHEVVVFSRSFVGLLLTTPLFIKHRKLLKTSRFSSHLTRTLIAVGTIYCSTYGIKHLALSDAMLFENTLPLFTPLIVMVWVGQKIPKKILAGILWGFLGVFILLKPKMDVIQFASLIALGAGFLSALGKVYLHELTKIENPLAILFYFLFISTLVSAYPAFSHFSAIHSPITWLYLILIGCLFTLFQTLLTFAYSLATPNGICGFSYLCLLFSIIWGFLFWDESFDMLKILGSISIMSAGLWIMFVNKLKDRSSIFH